METNILDKATFVEVYHFISNMMLLPLRIYQILQLVQLLLEQAWLQLSATLPEVHLHYLKIGIMVIIRLDMIKYR